MITNLINNLDFYMIFAMFFIYSFLGWLWEVFFVFLKTDQLVNRGFLNGPLCPIYGVGAVIVILLLTEYEHYTSLLFFYGMIIATTIEFITAYLLEVLFDSKWWDYSEKNFNIKGRICLSTSIGWGLFSVVLMKVINPPVRNVIQAIPKNIGFVLILIISMIFIADFGYTYYYIRKFNRKLAHMSISKEELKSRLENSRLYELYETTEELFSKLQANDNDFLEDLKLNFQKLKERQKLNSIEFDSFMEEVKEKGRLYQNLIRERTFMEKRMLKAFPKLKSIKHNDVLKDIKEILNKK